MAATVLPFLRLTSAPPLDEAPYRPEMVIVMTMMVTMTMMLATMRMSCSPAALKQQASINMMTFVGMIEQNYGGDDSRVKDIPAALSKCRGWLRDQVAEHCPRLPLLPEILIML